MNLEVCDIQLSKSKGMARNDPAFVILVETNFLESASEHFIKVSVISIANHGCCLNKKVLLLNPSNWLIF